MKKLFESWRPYINEGYDHDELNRDYGDLKRGEMKLSDFAKKYNVEPVAHNVDMDDYHKSYNTFDCGGYAEYRLNQQWGYLFKGVPHENNVAWWVKEEDPISWNEAKRGDYVLYGSGLWYQVGLVHDPERQIVESCWGTEGFVFRHHVGIYPTKFDGVKVYPVRRRTKDDFYGRHVERLEKEGR